MLSQIFPQRIDNAYRGYKLALWLFALVLLMKLAMSLSSIFNGYAVASGADGIPLDTFTPAGARTVVTLFALLGLSQLTICLLGLVVLGRYRGMVPFMFALLLVEFLGKRLLLQVLPIDRTGTPPGVVVNLVLLVFLIAGLGLSVRGQRTATPTRLPP